MKRSTYDIVVFGATSFVGKILCQHLSEASTKNSFSWAIAGRSEEKLKALKFSLGKSAEQLSIILADSQDENALHQLCEQASVVISTVGPYAFHGETLVKVCAETGTDYCDLAGEVQWIKQMIDRYETTAQQSGARIVHACGFDSIPSDLGVSFLQTQALKAYGKTCTTIKMRVKAIKGGVSGGTAASIVNVAREASKNAPLRRLLANPFALCPKEHGYSAIQYNVQKPRYDHDFSIWSAPFIMSAINTRIVHRSNALSANSYGQHFKYDEAMLTGSGTKGRKNALLISMGLASLMIGSSFKPSRKILEKFILPKPGEGPTPSQQEKGHYDLHFLGFTEDGNRIHTRVTGDRDPGYGSTAKILGQAGIWLATDLKHCHKPGGFWTPATIFDEQYIHRLEQHAGLSFTVIPHNTRLS